MRIRNALISLFVLAIAGYGALKLYVFYRAKENFQQILYCYGVPHGAFKAPKRSRNFDYDHISASVFGPIGIKGLKIRFPAIDEEIRFGEILLTYDYDGDLKTCPTPKHINFTIKHLKLSVSLLEKLEAAQAKFRERRGLDEEPAPELVSRLGYTSLYKHAMDFRALGYDDLDMTISFDLVSNPEDRQATFTIHERIKDLGDFNVIFTVDGMAKNIDSAVLGVKLKEAKIDYRDESYVSRLFSMFAKKNNEDVDAYRKSVVAEVTKDFSSKQIKLGEDSVKNLQDFLMQPKRLIVTMYPYQPVGIQSINMYKPGDVPLLLNLQIYTK